MSEKTRYWMLALPALAIMMIFYIWPVLNIFGISLTEPEPGFGNYTRMFDSNAVKVSFILTFRIAAITTFFCLLLGYIVAYTITTYGGRRGPLMLGLVLLPFWVSVLVRSFAWIVLLGRSGLVNDTMMDWGLIEAPIRLIHNELGVLISMVHVMLPFAILPILANMRGISQSHMLAARGLGASEWRAFREVYFPQTLPGVFSGGLLVFVLSLGFFITPALLGGGRVMMISEYISYQIQELLRWGLATALSSALLVATALVLIVAGRFVNLRKTFLERK